MVLLFRLLCYPGGSRALGLLEENEGEWRNWQTRRSQEPVPLAGRVGSSPTFLTRG